MTPPPESVCRQRRWQPGRSQATITVAAKPTQPTEGSRMSQRLSDSRLANLGAHAVYATCDAFQHRFNAITRRARRRFERRDWHGMQADAAEPWFSVEEHDIFHEELRRSLGLHAALRDIFMEQHADLFEAQFWRRVQARLQAGEVLDIFPYAQSERLWAGAAVLDSAPD